jgi:hypothetical protein
VAATSTRRHDVAHQELALDLHDEDLPALGWRHRWHYDMRATFITLAIEDGADPEILEARVTHTRKSRNAFDGYNRGLHPGADVCRDREASHRARLAQLGDRAADCGRSWPRFVAIRCIASSLVEMTVKNRGGGGSRTRLTMRSTTLRAWNLAHFAWSAVPRTLWSAVDRSELQRNRCRT